jgi:hypothetical protein
MTLLRLSTFDDCALVIGAYPRFRYDAGSGGGLGELGAADRSGRQPLRFDPATLRIPPLDRHSGRMLGFPLPPGPVIEIVPEELAGSLDRQGGDLRLRLRARFRFRLFSLYRAPDLLVDTELVCAPVRGRRHRAEGRPLDAEGHAVLVGVAPVEPSGDAWFDRLLGLPDEALAVLRCRLVPADVDALATLPPLPVP